MNVLAYADPAFRNTLWCAHTLRGIREETKRKKHTLVLLDDIPDPVGSLRARCDKEKTVVIVMGTSVSRLQDRLNELWDAGIHTILVNFGGEIPCGRSSTLVMDYAGAVRQGMDLLSERGAKKIALFGIGRESETDGTIRDVFLETVNEDGNRMPESNVYYLDEGLKNALSRFLSEADRYDGILFGNEIAAMGLTRALREKGMTDRFCTVGFADPTLTDLKLLLPDVEPLSASHKELGRQAVNLYTWLVNIPRSVSAAVRIPITVEGIGTGKDGKSVGEDRKEEIKDDPLQGEILAVERCISECDATDLAILRSLLAGSSKAEAAAGVFLTERAIKYRLRKMCVALGAGTQKQLLARLRPWLCGV